ncbi:hypothetical protein [Cohnella caldifontis]|uniref:hypothetical protein n=1 Tax=Cohnella caldifontis TaxID=3027471 RepID=UPI0023EB1CFC|nr:hypothetical protein [Cohnella sp. YIM B05605]
MKRWSRKSLLFAILFTLVFTFAVETPEQKAAAASAQSFKRIIAGDRLSYALDGDGRLYAWGLFSDFHFGGHRTPSQIDWFGNRPISDIAVINGSLAALMADGTVWMHDRYASSSDEPIVQVPGLSGISDISATELAVYARDNAGIVYDWNDYSATKGLYLRKRDAAIPDLAALYGGYAIKKDGTVWFLESSDTEPVQISGLASVTKIVTAHGAVFALKADGTVWTWGQPMASGNVVWPEEGWTWEPSKVDGLEGVRDLSAGKDHVIALKNDGTVWGWGKNDQAQLGKGLPNEVPKPVGLGSLHDIQSIGTGYGASHSFAVDKQGNVWSWGSNRSGETGTDSKEAAVADPKKLFFYTELDGKTAFDTARIQTSPPSIGAYAVSDNGLILAATDVEMLRSTDYGQTWTKQPLPVKEAGSAINVEYVSRNETFYYSPSNARKANVFWSKDGVKWTRLTLTGTDGAALNMLSVKWLNGQYIMTARDVKDDWGHQTYILTSADGYSWKQAALVPQKAIDIIWNGKRYVGLSGGYRYFGSTTSLNQMKIDAKEGLNAELIVYTSDDLTQWTMRSGTIKNLKYANPFFNPDFPLRDYQPQLYDLKADGTIVLMDDYGNFLESKDGIAFKVTRTDSQFRFNTLNTVYWNGSQYVTYLTEYYTNKVYLLTSKDKVKWTKKEFTAVPGGGRVEKVGSRFVLFGSRNRIAVSTDGLSWKTTVAPTPFYKIFDMLKNGGTYMAVGNEQTDAGTTKPVVQTSTDGKSWKTVFSSNVSGQRDGSLSSVAASGKGYAAVGGPYTVTSADGVKWSVNPLPSGVWLSKVVWSGSKFVALDNSHPRVKLYTSDNGVKWKEAAYKPSGYLTDLAAHNGTVVAVGYTGKQTFTVSSANLTNWQETKLAIGQDNAAWGVNQSRPDNTHVQWANDRFFIMADEIYSSKDGKKWTVEAGDYHDYAAHNPHVIPYGDILWTGRDYRYLTSNLVGVSADLKSWKFYRVDLDGLFARSVWTGSDVLSVTSVDFLLRVKDKTSGVVTGF